MKNKVDLSFWGLAYIGYTDMDGKFIVYYNGGLMESKVPDYVFGSVLEAEQIGMIIV